MKTLLPVDSIGNLVSEIQTWNPVDSGEIDPFTYIDISSVSRETKRIDQTQEVVPSDAPSRARQIVAEGDVLVSTVRPNLNAVAMVDNGHAGATASTGFCILRPRQDRLCSRYLYHWVRSPQFVGDMTAKATGASYPAVSDKIIKDSTLPAPPLSEQRRIAAILDKADAIRRKREEGIRLTEELLRSTFRHLFGDPNTNPKGWNLERLGEHIAFMTSGSRGWAEYYAETGVRFIRSLDVQMNRIGDDEPAFVNPPQDSEAARTRVQEGDVLLTITGSKVGRVAFVPKGFGHAYVSQHVAILRLNGHMRPRFASMFLTDEHGGQRQIKAAQYGQTKPGLNLDQIRGFLVPCPPLKDQDRFLDIWDHSDHMLRQRMHTLEQAMQLLGSLVQRAFRGEL